jgi:hypothetical protein
MIEGTFHFAEDQQAGAVHYDIRPPDADVVLVSTDLLLKLVTAYCGTRRDRLLIRHDLLGSNGPSEPVLRGYTPTPVAAPPRAIEGTVIEGTIL